MQKSIYPRATTAPQMTRQGQQMNPQALNMAAEEDEMNAPIIPTTNTGNRKSNYSGKPPAFPSAQGAQGSSSINNTSGVQMGQAPNLNQAPTIKQQPPTTYQAPPQQAGPNAWGKGNSGQTGRGRTGNNSSGNGAPPPNLAPVEGEATTVDQSDLGDTGTTSDEDLYNQAWRELLEGGPRNTAEQEALIREQMLRDVGAGQAGLNARLGASGFGTSGALGAMSGDMRATAALNAANSIQGVQQDARDEYLDQLGLGFSAGQDGMSLELRKAQFDEYQKMIRDLYGEQTPPPPAIVDNTYVDNATDDGYQNTDPNYDYDNALYRIGDNDQPETEEERRKRRMKELRG
jgi:hypothetical protein